MAEPVASSPLPATLSEFENAQLLGPHRAGLLGASTTSRLIAVVLVAWAAVLLGGSMVSETVHGQRMPALREPIILVAHLGSSLLLVAVAWIWFLGFSRSKAAGTAALFAAGMSLGAIGDFFNAGVLQDVIRLPDPVLGGIAAFAVGHLAYISACIQVAGRRNDYSRAKRVGAIAFWQIFSLVGWYFIVFRSTNAAAAVLEWPALSYSLLLAGTAGVATALALEDRRLAALGAGAVLFLTSDLILAFRMFQGDFPYASHAVWLTYGPGQMLIVASIGAACSDAIGRRARPELTVA